MSAFVRDHAAERLTLPAVNLTWYRFATVASHRHAMRQKISP
jgi:hypothetical protein